MKDGKTVTAFFTSSYKNSFDYGIYNPSEKNLLTEIISTMFLLKRQSSNELGFTLAFNFE